MQIKILYFGRPAEKLQCAEEVLEVPSSVTTLAGLMAVLHARGSDWAQELTAARIRCAVNQEFVEWSAPLKANDEVALFSPISGG